MQHQVNQRGEKNHHDTIRAIIAASSHGLTADDDSKTIKQRQIVSTILKHTPHVRTLLVTNIPNLQGINHLSSLPPSHPRTTALRCKLRTLTDLKDS